METESAVDVEYVPTTSEVIESDAAVNVERRDTITNVVVSDAAIMVEYRYNTQDYCGPGDTGLATYYEFSRNLECYMNRASEPGISITGAFTIGCWVEFKPAGSYEMGLISKWYEPTDERSFVLYKRPSGEIVFSISKLGINNLNTVTDLGIHYQRNKWMYIVARFIPSTEIALFINGEWYKNSTGIFDAVFDSSESFDVARYNRNNYLSGRLSHVFLSSEAIEDADIEAMYYHTKALFAPKKFAAPDVSGITLRMTNSAVEIEYLPDSMLYMTNAAVEIEYSIPDIERMTNAAVNVEYHDTVVYEYMTNAAVNVEYHDTVVYEYMTNAAVNIEYHDTAVYEYMTNAAVMIEYTPT